MVADGNENILFDDDQLVEMLENQSELCEPESGNMVIFLLSFFSFFVVVFFMVQIFIILLCLDRKLPRSE